MTGRSGLLPALALLSRLAASTPRRIGLVESPRSRSRAECMLVGRVRGGEPDVADAESRPENRDASDATLEWRAACGFAGSSADVEKRFEVTSAGERRGVEG